MSLEQRHKQEKVQKDHAVKKYKERKLDQEFESRLKSIDLDETEDIPNPKTTDEITRSPTKKWYRLIKLCLLRLILFFNFNIVIDIIDG